MSSTSLFFIGLAVAPLIDCCTLGSIAEFEPENYNFHNFFRKPLANPDFRLVPPLLLLTQALTARLPFPPDDASD